MAAFVGQESKNVQQFLSASLIVSKFKAAAADHQQPGTKTTIKDFEKQESVVFVVTIYGDDKEIEQLKQSLCLLKAAYPVPYDHIVFATIPVKAKDVQELQAVVAPSSLQVLYSIGPLQDALNNLTQAQQEDLCARCKVNSTLEITWDTSCRELFSSYFPPTPMRYRWQAEFRAKHLWFHPALKPYRYLFWFDSDAMCMQKWATDPIAIMRRNNVQLFFLNRAGVSWEDEFRGRQYKAFGQIACRVTMQEGHFVTTLAEDPAQYQKSSSCPGDVEKVHGFLHITDLRLYTSPVALKWYTELIGNDTFSRHWDDQIAVTMPGAILAPNQSWDMHSNGFRPHILHNGMVDGKQKSVWYRRFWTINGMQAFPEAEACGSLIHYDGRR